MLIFSLFFLCFFIYPLTRGSIYCTRVTLHLATSENRTSPECQRSRAEGQRDCFGCEEGSHFPSWSWRGDIPGLLRLITDSSIQSNNLFQCPGLQHPLLLLLQASRVHKLLYLDLCLIFLLLASAYAFSSSATSLSWRRMFKEDGAKTESNISILKHNPLTF